MNGFRGRQRAVEAIAFTPDAAQGYHAAAEAAIRAGRYLVFVPRDDGRILLLLDATPPLMASTVRQIDGNGDAKLIVEWLCEAADDHRDHLLRGDFRACCRDAGAVPEHIAMPA